MINLRLLNGSTVTILLITLLLAIPTSTRGANDVLDAIGPRVGIGLDPDQFVIGGQAVSGYLFKPVRFAPSADAGVGDDMLTITLNPDFRISIPIEQEGSAGSFYVSAGPTIALYFHDEHDNNSEIGLSLNGGAWLDLNSPYRYNIEGRIGLGDIPDIRVLFGVLF